MPDPAPPAKARDVVVGKLATVIADSTPTSPAADDNAAPPYWPSRPRTISAVSYASVQNRKAPIALEDHEGTFSSQSRALWARSATVDGYIEVQGGAGRGFGAYVVWVCKVETLDGGPMMINRRYSEFDLLRQRLIQTFPHSEAAMPPLPPKSVISKYRPKFLEKRQAGLSYFLNCILLNPEFAGSPVLKEFIFS